MKAFKQQNIEKNTTVPNLQVMFMCPILGTLGLYVFRMYRNH